MKLKTLASVMALGLGLGAVAAPAYASYLYTFEDDNLEWVLRPTTNGVVGLTEITSGFLQVGDILFSVFEMPVFEINGENAIPTGRELTGVAAIEVASIGSGGLVFNFTPWAGLNTLLGGGYTGAMVAMFLNDFSTDLDLVGPTPGDLSCITRADCTTQATDGTLFQVDGFLGDPDEFWNASISLVAPWVTPGELAEIKAGAASTTYVNFTAGLSNLFNEWGPVGFIDRFTGQECADTTGCVQFLVDGTVKGGGGLDTMTAVGRSDFDGQKYVQVPEPGTLALLGMGLLGLGATMRRRKA